MSDLIKHCKKCGAVISPLSRECPFCCPPLRENKGKKISRVLIIGCIAPFAIVFAYHMSTKSASRHMERMSASYRSSFASTEGLALYDPVQRWGEEKVASARKVMALVKQDCHIYEEGLHLVVEMRMYLSDPNQLLAYVRSIADTDVILHGKPRTIYFYDPSNERIAQADALNGVRLIY
jgi:hypothetical protein